MKIKNYSVFRNIIFTHKYIIQDYLLKYWIIAIAFVLVNVLVSFMLTYLPAYAVDLLTKENSVEQILLNVSLYFLILYSATIVFKRIEKNIDNKIDNDRMFKCLDYYDNIMMTNYINIDTSKGRDAFNAGLNSYMDGFHEGFTHIIVDFRALIQSVVGLIIYCTFIAKVNTVVALILILISSASIIINVLNTKWINKNKDKWFKLDTKLSYLATQCTMPKNAKDARLYSIKAWFVDTFDYLIALRQNWMKKELRIFFLANVSERVLTMLKYAVAYFVVFENVKSGGLDVSQFIMLVGLILGINNWISAIFNNIKYLQLNNVVVNNSRTAIEIDDNSLDRNNIELYKPIPLKEAHEIKFENVTFSFPETEAKIFDNFNLTIHKGEKLALVGINGAGKTTLVKLMCGLYKPSSGKIYLDGIDINTYKKEDYFKLISVVFQDFQVLALSIAENISAHAKDETDYEKVNKCIELSGLKEKINELENGVNTNMLKSLDKEGVVFSGGQVQKLMLARCLYKNSPIVVLDEPTSALDALAESEIYEKYSELIENKTSIFISHRLSSTKFCDRIIMLENGKIIEEGTHNKLLKQDGEYAKMYNVQSSYYQEEVEELVF